MTLRTDSEFLGKNIGEVTQDKLTSRGVDSVGVSGTEIAQAIETKVGLRGHMFLEVFSRIDAGGNIGQVNTYDMEDGVVVMNSDMFQIQGHETADDFFNTEIPFGKISGFGIQTEVDGDKRESIVFQISDFHAVYRLTKR